MTSLWPGTDAASQQEITSAFDRMSLQSWGLSSRTLNALLSYNFKMTVGDVIRADKSLATIRGLGKAGIEELNTKIAQVLAIPQSSEAQFPIDQTTVLPDTETPLEPQPKLLPPSVQSLSLDQLHLDTKTHAALVKAGITTIGDYIMQVVLLWIIWGDFIQVLLEI